MKVLEDTGGLGLDETKHNFVTAKINYDSMQYEIQQATSSADFAQLLSNLGGNMGFFIGISIISIVEVFGELIGLRLIPRLWEDKRLYEIGLKEN